MNNVLNLIVKDLSRHEVEVTLPGEKVSKKFYLIIMEAKTSLFEDFKETYKEEATKLHLKIAKKMFGKKEKNYNYGVLVDKDNKYQYAFNTKFADYNKKKKIIEYKSVDEIIENNIVPVVDLSNFSKPSNNYTPNFSGGSSNGKIRYSLSEK